MLGFTQQERKRRGGHTWWVLVVGEETDEDPMKDGAALSPPGKGRPRERAVRMGESKRRGERNRRRRARELMADFLFLFHNHFSQLHNNPAVN